MKRYLYIDGSCGISGDMMVASLLDLGGDRTKIDKAINSLDLDGFSYSIKHKTSYSISGLDFDVHLDFHNESKEECYSEHSKNSHNHRHLHDIVTIIDSLNINYNAKVLANKIFLIVAEAEAKAHGVKIEDVHFHEVGAIDSIIDIISIAILIDDLSIKDVILTKLSDGTGEIKCQHGILNVPVPAVINIAEKYNIPLNQILNNGEMVTPTGIASLAALNPINKMPKVYKIIKSGIGLGKRDFGHANFLRTMIIEETFENNEDNLYIIETNIDDCSGEVLSYAMDKVFEAGAIDVYYKPCYMKKNRPAYIFCAITNIDKLEEVEYTILKYTTTIGVRHYPITRTTMNRIIKPIKLEFGEVYVKISTYKDIVRIQPEFESVKKLASDTGKDFQFIYNLSKHVAMKEEKK